MGELPRPTSRCADEGFEVFDRLIHGHAESEGGMKIHYATLGKAQPFDREQTLALVDGVYEPFADFKQDVQGTLAADDHVILRIVDRATHTG